MAVEENTIKEFQSICGDVEFARAEDLAPEIQKEIDMKEGLVIVQKSINPGATFLPIKDNDFVGFLINELINDGRKEELREPFKDF